MAADNVNCEALRIVLEHARASLLIRKVLGTRNETEDAELETSIWMLQKHVDKHDEMCKS